MIRSFAYSRRILRLSIYRLGNLKERCSSWNVMLYSHVTCKPRRGVSIGVPPQLAATGVERTANYFFTYCDG
jgi:hypothetical protein